VPPSSTHIFGIISTPVTKRLPIFE
jgi:hypothetical protein